jgi:hypothetical protein
MEGEMKTSETATELGVYASECCGEELIFDDGDTFSRCMKCNRLCEWEMIDVAKRGTEMEEEEHEAA